MGPPNDLLERVFDNQAFNDIAEFQASRGTQTDLSQFLEIDKLNDPPIVLTISGNR